ncbi:hypothetical protein NIES2101_39350 [Calothrix sp. HK-06]|nr:hypothetical protein NIES2101_39350 [Calothrix sp. HK-06]
MDCLLGIIRKTDRLIALVSSVKHQFDLSSDNLSTMGIDSEKSLYEIIESPLELLAPSIFAKKEQLIASWNYLSCVDELNAETLFHILVILIETAPDLLESEVTLQPLPVDSSKQIIKPTAAHPRAYKGTKQKPPKPKAFSKTDLKLYLCDKKHQNQLLLRLSKHWVEALKKLENVGYEVHSLSSVPTEDFILNPYYAYHHNLHVAIDSPELPIHFHRYLLSSLKGLGWKEVIDYLSIYWGLSLDSQLNLLPAISRLLSQRNDNTLKWCQIITQQPDSRRLIFTTILIETKAYSTRVFTKDIERFNQIAGESNYAYWLYCFFGALKKGISADYILAGFKLASKFQPDYHCFHDLNKDSWFPEQAVERLVDIGNTMQWEEKRYLYVWEDCRKLEGLIDIILYIDWKHYADNVKNEYLYFYLLAIDLYGDDVQVKLQKAKWKFIRGQVDIIDTLLRKVEPEFQSKAIEDLKQYYWHWDKTQELELYIPYAHAMVQRLAQPPFSQKSHAAKVIIRFINYLGTKARDLFLNASDTSFLRLEEACRLDNNTWLIAKGIGAITKYISDFSLQCFISYPNKLFKVARLLGSLSTPISESIVKTFSQHPIITQDITILSLKDACDFINNQCNTQFSNPIPRKIRDYLQGKCSLSEQQINRGLGLIYKQVQLTQLDVLENLTLNILKREFDVNPKQENIKHALSLLGTIQRNNRCFRKFLKAYWNNQPNYIINHPLTQTWLKQHSKININLWMNGIEYRKLVDQIGAVEIKLESEPLEVLKLGTYVGTCLGLGGICSDSAVAVLLDINKQVLYARNKEGIIIARQLVAISEEEELVCFYVYPDGVSTSIKKIFREYDVKFAEALGIKLFQNSTDSNYNVENIISESWWDDDAWDFTV